jgi:TetR/AcrR family transcriptional repressor of mexJK operon
MKAAKTASIRRGRPSRLQAEQIEEHILATATALFLTQGYGATSIEEISQQAGISKRTLYHRFSDKAELFAAVVHRLITQLRPEKEAELFAGTSLPDLLLRLGKVMLHASLSKEALGLHRLLLSEAARFPELAHALDREGTRQEAVHHIAALLKQESNSLTVDANFAAEQFMQMIMSTPQRRALGIGAPMTRAELNAWVTQTVALFLRGIGQP